MVQFASITFIAAAAFAASLPRDVLETITNLESVDAQVNTLTQTTVAWDGSGAGALAIVSAVSMLQSNIETGTLDASDESTASSADSQTILDYVTGTLGPDFTITLNELVSRQADIESIGASSDVLSSLGDLKSDVDAYGAALITITSPDLQADAQIALTSIDGEFDAAIAVFS
ncbi:hypothetical protein JX265_006963 [Neoarthrinium moseri]|uniref:Hydrophobic surface binding protein n=1 Tax=Neoarthrinium moseri TaxID=1658444 RepID=A0A9P9WL38_9PEZI|nr:uncharacterized protein JN550_010191 [Neoarthrinium moseri]KAI1845199.1 hypothetical protein JX266_008746 [Neoarthrinium moseri]KAI1862666.1 hypothetical protein JN550_010191 [Neoarthrinium moseri]KAI1868984.1 hypothetical protein JX265_006963 [Neoarthrinium moseri]